MLCEWIEDHIEHERAAGDPDGPGPDYPTLRSRVIIPSPQHPGRLRVAQGRPSSTNDLGLRQEVLRDRGALRRGGCLVDSDAQ